MKKVSHFAICFFIFSIFILSCGSDGPNCADDYSGKIDDARSQLETDSQNCKANSVNAEALQECMQTVRDNYMHLISEAKMI